MTQKIETHVARKPNSRRERERRNTTHNMKKWRLTQRVSDEQH